MSQEGIIDIIGTHPEIPTEFVANVESAVPIANVLEVLGEVVAAGINPFRSIGSGNTITYQAQISQAIAATDATKIGLSAFNSAQFSVDANGFVSLSGGGLAVDSFQVQALTAPGVNPVLPDVAGLVTVNGAAVANHSVVLESRTRALNTYNIEIQYATSSATTDATKSGVAHFKSTEFTVDANGFVSLLGGGQAVDSFQVQQNTAPGVNPVIPDSAGLVTVSGAVVTNHSVVLETRSRALNAYNLEIQYATSAAATDGTKSGVAHFNSTQFSVDASGFVALAGGGQAIDSIGVQTGASNPIVPTAAGLVTINGAVVAAGTNPVRSDGTSANTMALEVQISQAIASTDATKIGLSAFDSAAFDVDANGFVQLNGGGIAVTSFDVQANTAPGNDPVVPTSSGVVTVNGAAVVNHSVVLETRSRAANAYNLEIQYSAAVAATDATKSGVSHFDSSRFTVDANGFVSLNGSGVAETITGQSGLALSPTAGNWNISGGSVVAGTSPLVSSGSGSTLTLNVQRSQAIASADSTKVGVSNFYSGQFAVDSNGFVTIVSGGMPWTDVTGATQALSVQNGYITDRSGGVTYTLPSTATLGDIIKIDGKLGLTTITQNASQAIRMGSSISTTGVGGSVAGTNLGDCITLRCTTAGASTIWIAENWVGSFTVT